MHRIDIHGQGSRSHITDRGMCLFNEKTVSGVFTRSSNGSAFSLNLLSTVAREVTSD